MIKAQSRKYPGQGLGQLETAISQKGLRHVRVQSDQAATAQSIFKISLEEYVHSVPIYAPGPYIQLPRWHLFLDVPEPSQTQNENDQTWTSPPSPPSVIRDLSITHFSKTKTVVLITLRHLLLLCPSPPNSHKVYLMLLSCCSHPSTCPAPWTQAQTLLPWITGLLTLWRHFYSPLTYQYF